ncbi:MAG: cation:proton antiporter [Bryobacteraceae bacterium]
MSDFPLALLLAIGPDTLSLPLAMLIVFGSAKLLAELMEKLGQPGLVGEILAGILIGPSVLGLVRTNDLLHALSELGVMFLLFRVGLEVKPSELLRVGGTATIVAVAGVVVPFALGWGIMRFWGETRVESIFVGAAMVATSVGITAQVLAAQGLLSHVASRTILAAAVIDDVLGLLVLALVSSLAKGQVNVAGLATTAVLAIGFTVVVALWGTRAMQKVVPKVEQRLRAGEVQFNLAMVLLFALAMMASYVGVAAIIGAFLAGMALSESVAHRVHDLAHGVTELLVPFFLAGIGLNLDVASLGNASTLALAAVVFVAAVLAKLVGCGLGAWSLGRANMWRVGLGMVPRGEVGMVVAQIGLGMGVISQGIYGVVVFMAVMTTIIAPPLLRISYKGVRAQEAEERFRIG